MYLLYSTFPEDCHLGNIKEQDDFETKEALMETIKFYKWLTDGKVKLVIDQVSL